MTCPYEVVRENGIEVHDVPRDANGVPVYYEIERRSLLGLFSGAESTDLDLVEHELMLARRMLDKGEKPSVLFATDWDGVIHDPWVHEVLGQDELPSGAGMEWFERMAPIPAMLVVWTSRPRFAVPVERVPFIGPYIRRSIDRRVEGKVGGRMAAFPFIDETMVTNIERMGGGNTLVVDGGVGGRFRKAPKVWDLILRYYQIYLDDEEARPDMVYFVGSTPKDARAARDMGRVFGNARCKLFNTNGRF